MIAHRASCDLAIVVILPISGRRRPGVEPGSDIAFPRVLISTRRFVTHVKPNRQTLEPGIRPLVYNTT